MRLIIFVFLAAIGLASHSPARAQIMDKLGRMYITSREGMLIELKEGVRFHKSFGISLPQTPQGLTWVRVGVTADQGAEIYELTSLQDPRHQNQEDYELLEFLDNMRETRGHYSREKRMKMIADVLKESRYTEADAITLARRLTDPASRHLESLEILKKFQMKNGCTALLPD